MDLHSLKILCTKVHGHTTLHVYMDVYSIDFLFFQVSRDVSKTRKKSMTHQILTRILLLIKGKVIIYSCFIPRSYKT